MNVSTDHNSQLSLCENRDALITIMESEDEIDILVDENDEVQDYKFLNKQLPKTGEKDFEPDGTNFQVDKLEESKQLMFEVLQQPIKIHEKLLLQGIFLPHDDETVILNVRGNYFKDLGRHLSVQGKSVVILNKLETLYLVERGSMILYLCNDKIISYLNGEINSFSYHDLVPLSLQYLYSHINSFEIQKYQVFAYLKRLGYLVRDYTQVIQQEQEETWLDHLYTRLIGISAGFQCQKTNLGINIKTTHYQTFTEIFEKLNFIPSATTYSSSKRPTKSSYDVHFNVWKPRNAFSKKNLPKPDFHICITNEFPKLDDIHHLFNKINYDIEPLNFDLNPKAKDSKLRHGTGRSVIVAVINNGVNFVNLSEVDFKLKDAKVRGYIH